jgi:membrane protein
MTAVSKHAAKVASPGRFRRACEAAAMLLALDAGRSFWQAAARRLPGARGTQPAAGLHAADARPDSPAHIARRGCKQILLRVFNDIGNDRVMAEAAAVTYYTLLAIFPALAALISLYGLVADPSTIARSLDALHGVMPDGGVQILSDQIHSLTATPNKALGFGALLGLVVSLWSANAGVKSLFDALNAVYGEKETRTFFHRTWLSMAFTLGALAFVILAMAAVVVVPTMLNYVGLTTIGDVLLRFGRWPLLMVALMLFLALTYRFGPSRARAKWRLFSWGSVFAAITWIVASAGFSWYVANFGSYNKTYGSLGAAVGFMTWIWISTIIVLIGAELNAELENQA